MMWCMLSAAASQVLYCFSSYKLWRLHVVTEVVNWSLTGLSLSLPACVTATRHASTARMLYADRLYSVCTADTVAVL